MITNQIHELDTSQLKLFNAGQKAQKTVAGSDIFAFQSLLRYTKAGHMLKIAADML